MRLPKKADGGFYDRYAVIEAVPLMYAPSGERLTALNLGKTNGAAPELEWWLLERGSRKGRLRIPDVALTENRQHIPALADVLGTRLAEYDWRDHGTYYERDASGRISHVRLQFGEVHGAQLGPLDEIMERLSLRRR